MILATIAYEQGWMLSVSGNPSHNLEVLVPARLEQMMPSLSANQQGEIASYPLVAAPSCQITRRQRYIDSHIHLRQTISFCHETWKEVHPFQELVAVIDNKVFQQDWPPEHTTRFEDHLTDYGHHVGYIIS